MDLRSKSTKKSVETSTKSTRVEHLWKVDPSRTRQITDTFYNTKVDIKKTSLAIETEESMDLQTFLYKDMELAKSMEIKPSSPIGNTPKVKEKRRWGLFHRELKQHKAESSDVTDSGSTLVTSSHSLTIGGAFNVFSETDINHITESPEIIDLPKRIAKMSFEDLLQRKPNSHGILKQKKNSLDSSTPVEPFPYNFSTLPAKPKLTRGLSRSLSREFEERKFETKRLDFPEHSRSQTRHHPIETDRIYSRRDNCKVLSPTGKIEVSYEKVNQYYFFETIGTGAYGRVVVARDDVSNEEFACKIISKKRILKKFRLNPGSTNQGLSLIKREVAILKKVSYHPNIIKLYEVLDDSADDNLYMFFELCRAGPVMTITVGSPVTPFTEPIARKYFRDVLLGLEFLHYNRIIHRDIKPENLLINSEGVVQIGDFGISHMFETGDSDTFEIRSASPLFTPPCALESGAKKMNGKRGDIWSLGVTLYCFVHGFCPFEDDFELGIYKKILEDEPKINPKLSKNLKDILAALLIKSCKQRITLPKLKIHPWVTEDGKNPMMTTEVNCSFDPQHLTEEDVEHAFKPMFKNFIRKKD